MTSLPTECGPEPEASEKDSRRRSTRHSSESDSS